LIKLLLFELTVLDRINSTTLSDKIEKIGVELEITLCNSLISNGVDGLHFYIINMSFATKKSFPI
jgi:5,10-methylenetetrahydrofolate reductase